MIWLLLKRAGTDAKHHHRAKTQAKEPKIEIDEQTGRPFELVPEKPADQVVAYISAAYSTVVLGFLLWLLFDTWSRRNMILNWAGYDKATLASATFRLMAFVAIGGALGGTLQGIRSNIFWHSEEGAYGRRFLSRDLALPLVGAAVGLVVYLAVRSGTGVVSGDFSLNQPEGLSTMSAFTVAALAGFSSRQVFRWLDARASQLFRLTKVTQTIVPDLSGKTVEETEAALKNRKLTLGGQSMAADETTDVDVVLRQSPAAGAVVPEQASVEITIGPRTDADPEF